MNQEHDSFSKLSKQLFEDDCTVFLFSFLCRIPFFSGDECNVQILAEGPNPYADEYSETGTEGEAQAEADHQAEGGDASNMVSFEDLTGAVYYLISKREQKDQVQEYKRTVNSVYIIEFRL